MFIHSLVLFLNPTDHLILANNANNNSISSSCLSDMLTTRNWNTVDLDRAGGDGGDGEFYFFRVLLLLWAGLRYRGSTC